jgi:uncharacterized DUF497 family protein
LYALKNSPSQDSDFIVKFDRYKDTQFFDKLNMVTQALEIESGLSDDEDRFILLGVSHSLSVILVCHCYRSEGNVARIISARKATPKESKAY